MMKHETKITLYSFGIVLMCIMIGVLSGCIDQKARVQTEAQENGKQPSLAQIPAPQTGNPAKVYFTTDISPADLMAMYEALGRKVSGKVAVKISTGEPGGHHFLSPDLIKDLVQSVNCTIVESNTAYGGRRISTAMHKQVAIDHGFATIAPVDILDEEGSIRLPFANGKNITEDYVGSHFANYDSYLVLSHFKGHGMGGFGGALKNISIGIASSEGKRWIHSGGESMTDPP
jgi:uncharacterized Fe-S center protein